MERMPDMKKRPHARIELENCPDCKATGKDARGNSCRRCSGSGKLPSARGQ